MPVFAVHYDYAENSDAARDEHRASHRAFLGTLTEPPVISMATGPYVEEPAGALLVMRADSAADVETRLDEDPFWIQHLISRRQVREWTQVKGPWA